MLALAANLGQEASTFQTALHQVLTQIQQWGWRGVAVFIVLYSLATIAFIPGSLLTLGAGWVYGVVQGTLYVFMGASLGAVLAFWVGRYWARAWVTEKLWDQPRFQAIDRAVERQGFKIVLLTRLSPVFPFNLLNYALGITSVSLRDYVLGCVGMLPGTILYVYLGSLAGSLATLGTPAQPANPVWQWLVYGLGLIATLAVVLLISRMARQVLTTSVSEAGSASVSHPAE